ncbi:MAG: aminotransferase class V-fold PLP-dependent enzyme, partial [Bacteroidaceae bacterium]|nr:aminotransferase class V-fold PLP-dependent enzyme [Bacteroidaceae bacterium]
SKAYNATVIVDGSQSVGLLEYNLKKSQFDYLIFAGHKNLYASWGIGSFIISGLQAPVRCKIICNAIWYYAKRHLVGTF